MQFHVGVPWKRIYVPMEGDRRRNNKKRTKEINRWKGFCKVAFFFLSSFSVCFPKVFSTCDFGPNLVVFFDFGDSITFEFLKFLIVILFRR